MSVGVSNSKTVLSAFNNHFIEFLEEIEGIFPENRSVYAGKMKVLGLKKVNPSIIIKNWKVYVADKYRDQLEHGDTDFIIEKDYSQECENLGGGMSGVILRNIENMRESVRQMGEENKKKSMKYMTNLIKLCDLYFATKGTSK